MRVLLVARDKAPSDAFVKLTSALFEAKADYEAPIGGGFPIGVPMSDFAEKVKSSDAVLCGMSSTPGLAKEEIVAAEAAAAMGVPFGFYADTFGAIKRPWFAHLGNNASFIFVINGKEAAAAREIFPNARIVVSGNPMWEDFFTPKLPREEVRRRLEIMDRQRVILCPGGKLPVVNIQHFGGTISAANMMYKYPDDCVVVLSVHPGDEYYRKDPHIYDGLARYSKTPVLIVPQERMSGSELIAGCDVVVESASTIGIEAVCQRKPVIEFFSETALGRLEELTGSREWELCCEQGVAENILYDPSALSSAMHNALVGSDAALLRKLQEELYPAPKEKGIAIRMMVDALRSFAKA